MKTRRIAKGRHPRRRSGNGQTRKMGGSRFCYLVPPPNVRQFLSFLNRAGTAAFSGERSILPQSSPQDCCVRNDHQRHPVFQSVVAGAESVGAFVMTRIDAKSEDEPAAAPSSSDWNRLDPPWAKPGPSRSASGVSRTGGRGWSALAKRAPSRDCQGAELDLIQDRLPIPHGSRAPGGPGTHSLRRGDNLGKNQLSISRNAFAFGFRWCCQTDAMWRTENETMG
jgi:hypothetical protein